jgi:hypothetical protein
MAILFCFNKLNLHMIKYKYIQIMIDYFYANMAIFLKQYASVNL